MSAPTHHPCEGCPDAEQPTAAYDVTFHAHAGGTTERVWYCPDCAALAAADWNGNTAAIVPVQGVAQ